MECKHECSRPRIFLLKYPWRLQGSMPRLLRRKKKKNVKTLSVTVEGGDCLYQCHHCGLSGRYNRPSVLGIVQPQKVRAISVPTTSNQELINKYLLSRSIDPLSVTSQPLVSGLKYFNGVVKLMQLVLYMVIERQWSGDRCKGSFSLRMVPQRTLWGK